MSICSYSLLYTVHITTVLVVIGQKNTLSCPTSTNFSLLETRPQYPAHPFHNISLPAATQTTCSPPQLRASLRKPLL